MPHRLSQGLGVALAALLAWAACGPPRSDRSAPAPSVAPRDFATGKEALELAREKVPSASQLLRMTVTFPRDGGRAEFWSVELVDPTRAGQPYRVDIEAKRVVSVQDAISAPEAVTAAFDQILIDSRDAALVVEKLDWVGAGHEVVLQSTPWVVGGAESPEAVRGKPTWRLQVVRRTEQGTLIEGLVWVSSQSGAVVLACRTQVNSPC